MSLSGEPIKGEVLRFSRWHTAGAVVCLSQAVVLGGEAIVLVTIATRHWPADIWFYYTFGVLGLLAASGLAAVGWDLLTHKPCLVLGNAGLQFRLGKHVRWQVRYSDISDIGLFAPVHPRGYRRLGIRLANPALFDGTYPRLARTRARHQRQWGFDLGISLACSFEPPDRCVEAVLRCYHLFNGQSPTGRPQGQHGGPAASVPLLQVGVEAGRGSYLGSP
jgi:hypothetical protein